MQAPARHRLPSRRAVTLIECAGAAIILGLMITAGLRAAAGAGAAQAVSARALTGSLLAEGLMNEITARSYAEPSGATTMGIDSGEVASNKTTFDDVDDFHNWTESPPQSPDGSPIPNMISWSRSVKVYRAQLAAPDSNSASESGLKRIEVSVTCAGKLVCRISALRAVDP